MRKIFISGGIFLLLLTVLVPLDTVAKNNEAPAFTNSGKGDISSSLDKLKKDIEDIDKKMRNAESGSRKEMNLRHEREKLALEAIHECQRFFLNNRKNDPRARKTRQLFEQMDKILVESAKKSKDFLYPDRMQNVNEVLEEIRAGKLNFPGRIPKSDSVLLKDIQKIQKKALEEFHKEERQNWRSK